jgi:hypothetical protein
MRTQTIFALAAAIALRAVSAQDYSDDYPAACQDVCGPVAARSDSCDDQFENDQDELTCLCTGPNMNNLIPECQACVAANPDPDDDDDDSNEDLEGMSMHICNVICYFADLCMLTSLQKSTKCSMRVDLPPKVVHLPRAPARLAPQCSQRPTVRSLLILRMETRADSGLSFQHIQTMMEILKPKPKI